MGSVEVPSQGAQIIKVPAAHYEFGVNLIDQRVIVLPCLYFVPLTRIFLVLCQHTLYSEWINEVHVGALEIIAIQL